MTIKSSFLLLVLLLMGGCSEMDSVQEQVEKKYTDSDGLIHAYPETRNSEYLSESIGLYMEYLVLVEDKQNFSEQYEILKKYFLIQESGFHFIPWRLKENAATNALIDDLRIISALEKATEIFGDKEYRILADNLSHTLATVQHRDHFTVDFYDWSLAIPARRITLSYLADHQSISAESFKLLEDVDADHVFFPEYYDIATNKYVSGHEVHMIDQLLIALNREKRGQGSEIFANWLIEEWSTKQKIYGRYDRKTLESVVEYESLAVYYYLHAYFSEIGEIELMNEVSRHANEIATAETLSQAHFFDFIHYQLMLEKQ